jgi:hypothetical protein
MGWIETKLEKAKAQGTVPFVMWVIAKFLIGVGIAFLIAGAFPGYGWITWGAIFIVLGIIFAIPMMKAFLRKH